MAVWGLLKFTMAGYRANDCYFFYCFMVIDQAVIIALTMYGAGLFNKFSGGNLGGHLNLLMVLAAHICGWPRAVIQSIIGLT
jgi:hypothetical protein